MLLEGRMQGAQHEHTKAGKQTMLSILWLTVPTTTDGYTHISQAMNPDGGAFEIKVSIMSVKSLGLWEKQSVRYIRSKLGYVRIASMGARTEPPP